MKKQKEQEVQVSIRLPKSTHDHISQQAKLNYRSFQGETVKALSETFDIVRADKT